MNVKVFAILIFMIVMAGSILIISSENANTQPAKPYYEAQYVKNGLLIDNYSAYSVVEHYNSTGTKTNIYINTSYGTKSNSKISPTIQPDLTLNGIIFCTELNISYNLSSINNLPLLQINGSTNYVENGITYFTNLNFYVFGVYSYGNEHYTSIFDVQHYNNLSGASRLFNTKLTISTTNLVYNQSTSEYMQSPYSIVYTPISYLYNSNDFANGSNYNVPTYVFEGYYNNNVPFSTSTYIVQFNYSVPFNLEIDNISITAVSNEYRLALPNGTYTYALWTTNKSNATIGSVTVYGKNVFVNVSNIITLNYTELVQLGLYTISMTALLFYIIRISRGSLIPFSLTSILYVYVGYIYNIKFFDINMIMYLLTFVVGLFVYNLILKEN